MVLGAPVEIALGTSVLAKEAADPVHAPFVVGQTHAPPEQTSAVQALPSEQVFVSSFV
jgi:hypothetical protein